MNIAVLMGVFFVLLFLGVPIAYSLCLSAVLYMALFMDVPMIIIGQQMLKGVDSFTLMAIPFFVIAGGLMESGGISKRIVNFARTVVGHLPGGLAIVTVVASMIFAAMTGAGAATTAAVGGIMIPSMQEEGYDGGYASAVQAVAEYSDLLFRQVYLWFYMELHPENLWVICCWQDLCQDFFLG